MQNTNRTNTFYNPLNWSNNLNNILQAWVPVASTCHRIFYDTIAFIESIPVVGQIYSFFGPSTVLANLARREIRHIQLKEPNLPHQARSIAPQAPLSEVIDVTLPSDINNLDMALFPLHRQIEKQYQALPWPAQMQKIVILTEVRGGRGDIAAAAKIIAFMQKLCPTLTFDWLLLGADPKAYDIKSFLNCDDPSKISIRFSRSAPPEQEPCDLLIAGPVKLSWDNPYIEGLIGRKIAGPIFGFMENAEAVRAFPTRIAPMIVNEPSLKDSKNNEIYQTLHSFIFPYKSGNNEGLLPMGIQPGTGIFLDQSQIEARLSRGYCCPSYLLQIEDVKLRKDILEAMNVFDEVSEPDYDQHSFNSGYAHHPVSWGKFIDCVAIHEKNKHSVIVLNQKGEFKNLTTQEFQDQILTPERLDFLKQKGYGTVLFKGQEKKTALLRDAENPHLERRLTVIVRPSFNPKDLKRMQLASERLIATGDNSAVESWCSRCKLYLYEDVANMNCKWRFLQQQVDLAQTISPNLSKLLALFGGDRRIPNYSLNKPLNASQMLELEKLLNSPDLDDATLQFCDRITSTYSFYPVLEGALKRTAWHHYIPELANIETETLDENFREGLIHYLKNPKATKTTLCVSNISELSSRIDRVVKQHTKDNS